MTLSVEDIKSIMNHAVVLFAIVVVSLPFVEMLNSFVGNVTEDIQRWWKERK